MTTTKNKLTATDDAAIELQARIDYERIHNQKIKDNAELNKQVFSQLRDDIMQYYNAASGIVKRKCTI